MTTVDEAMPEVPEFITDEGDRRKYLESVLTLNEVVANEFLTRQDFMRKMSDPRRDLNEECGYPKGNDLTAEKYRDLYERNPIASRVNDLLPSESWKVQPTIYETEDEDNETEFEAAWKDTIHNLRYGSHFKDEEGNPVWDVLQRLDKSAGIGNFGVLLLGVDDGEELDKPIKSVEQVYAPQPGIVGFGGQPTINAHDNGKAPNGKPKATKDNRPRLMYVRVFDASLVQITKTESDRKSPRYGQPTEYALMFQVPTADGTGTTSITSVSKNVHWTRVIHVADNIETDESYGNPRMLPVLNRLLDLDKLYGGSAEMYWRGAFPGLALETHPSLGPDVKLNTESTKKALFNYEHTLKRYLAVPGVTVKTLAPQVVDPSKQIEIQIDAICIQLAVPKRIFMGSERGELASSQDKDSWDERMVSRQRNYITPRLIIPFVDRLIHIGVLPEPKEGFKIDWPELREMNTLERAEVSSKYVEMMAKYIGGGLDTLVPPKNFLISFLNLDEEEADQILEDAIEHINEANPDEEDVTVPGRNPKPEALSQEGEEGMEPEDDKSKTDKGAPPQAQTSGKKTPPNKGGSTPPTQNQLFPDDNGGLTANKIVKLPNGKYQVQSEDGKNLGTYPKKREAEKRLKQVEYFKHTANSQEGEYGMGESIAANNCGVGSGGFQPGNTCAKGGSSGPSPADFPHLFGGSPPATTPSTVKKKPARKKSTPRKKPPASSGDQVVRRPASKSKSVKQNLTLSKEDKAGIRSYTDDDDYKRVNKSLRKGTPVDKVPPPYVARINTLAQKPLPKGTEVYRGVPNSVASKIIKGNGYTAKGLSSTSLDGNLAAEFGSTVLKIRSKRGLAVSKYSKYPNEKEIIQSHGEKYRLVSVERQSFTVGPLRKKQTKRVLVLEQL